MPNLARFGASAAALRHVNCCSNGWDSGVGTRITACGIRGPPEALTRACYGSIMLLDDGWRALGIQAEEPRRGQLHFDTISLRRFP
jgi:hypothetical protein